MLFFFIILMFHSDSPKGQSINTKIGVLVCVGKTERDAAIALVGGGYGCRGVRQLRVRPVGGRH